MNADGTGLTRVTMGFADLDPAWSPDCSKIAFVSNRDGLINSIYTVNVDGTNLTRITNKLPYSDQGPAWSPDGNKLAFGTNEGSALRIGTVNADGSGRTLLTSAFGMNPAWSPDGTKIAFAGNVGAQGTQIVVMNFDGTQQTRITNNNFNDDHPSWSPDGTRIVFERNATGQNELFVMDADGGNQINLTNGAHGEQPDWQRAAPTPTPTPTPTPPVGFTVTRADDRNATCVVGDCSLREAVGAANADATDEVINFAPKLTAITLSGEIQIQNNRALVINGSGANVLTIDAGAGINQIFFTNNATVTSPT
jgi:CSLREA domain-containing protein